MAKILVLFHQPIIDNTNPHGIVCFYESFINELVQQGNDVKYINTNFLKDYYDTKIKFLNHRDKEDLITKIKKFNPDIIFTFNNIITEEIIENTNCLICLMDADGVGLFSAKDLIKLYKDRLQMFSFSEGWENEKYTSVLGLDDKQISYLHLATSIKNQKTEKQQNISFIGSNFGESFTDFLSKCDKKNLQNDLINYYNNQYSYANDFLAKYSSILNTNEINIYNTLDNRHYVLQSISDLGLKIYGVNWNKLSDDYLILKAAFDETPKYTLQNNQDVYNSSKINISISHPQCKGYAFPWRIYDIMASNGLLISSYSKLLEKQTKGIVDIPMFQSPYDARELCKYALNNPNYCEDIIAASNEFVEKFGRWDDNIKSIEDKIGIKLTNGTTDGNASEVLRVAPPPISKRFRKHRFKNIFNGISLILMHLPITDKMYTQKRKEKIYNSIKKYKIV